MKNKSCILSAVCVLALLFSSCITNRQKLYLQNDANGIPYRKTPFEQYKLGVNDEIIYYLITTSQETQYLYNGNQRAVNQGQIAFRIYDDGCVILPTIGKVKIAGLNIREAERVITEQFKSIVVDAEVKIALNNNYFYVEGNGGKGQFYVYKEDLNIFQAMAMAGDISSTGDKQHIKLIRRGEDGIDHIKTFDLREKTIIGSEYYYIRPNDVIYIPENPNAFFRVDSISSFISFVVAPLSLVMMALSYFK
ncbi:MAG: polysaccharide biosynthesis/export family protein [Candidatus Symbiothrix sp.]|jgi:polysaccharide export outer membrane protein|nr:polysaccharide biosynthesis/export family protein [Candidatus Symbiothrix sp.]